MKRRKFVMICDECCQRANCEEMPDKKGRCSYYLKDGEIVLGDEIKINPSDTLEYDYDFIRWLSDKVSSESSIPKLN
jgi:hypothetical protein